MSNTVDTATEIRPFQLDFSQEGINELRRRVGETRWPTKELVEDRSQGVQLATSQKLAQYWTTEYDWRRCEARLNALPQFMTEVDGVDVHFRSEEHTSELQSLTNIVCRLLLEKKKQQASRHERYTTAQL